jgi:hypothetical protein
MLKSPNHDASHRIQGTIQKLSMSTSAPWRWFCNMQTYMLQKLLNIEQFCHWKFNKMKTKFFSGISVCSWHYWKMINDYDFMEVTF